MARTRHDAYLGVVKELARARLRIAVLENQLRRLGFDPGPSQFPAAPYLERVPAPAPPERAVLANLVVPSAPDEDERDGT